MPGAFRIVPLAGFLLRLSLCPDPVPAAEPAVVERRLSAMGTLLTIRVAAPDRARALDASEAAAREIARVEDLLSTWKPGGPLDRVNRAQPGEPVDVGAEMAGLLARIFAWSDRTKRAFDPTVLPLVRAWDLRGTGRVPKQAELGRALAATGPDRFSLDAGRGEASRLSAGAGLDEGAWGKGYALDRAAESLRQAGVREALVDLGGQVLAMGRARVAVADPRDRGRAAASLTIADASVSTSGNSERGLVAKGRRIGHLLDPRRGTPAPDFGSATVIAPSGLVADVLSTAFFVLGPQKGLALSEVLRREGVQQEVIFLVARGGAPEVIASPGARDLVEPEPPQAAPAAPAAAQTLQDKIAELERLLAQTRQDLAAVRAQLARQGTAPADQEKLAELERKIEILAREIEALKIGESAVLAEDKSKGSRYGVGPAASKVYRGKAGVSIGGYGEFKYNRFASQRQDGAPSEAGSHVDLARAVVYLGYKFDDHFLLNTEIEFAHAVTASDKGGEVEVEFAYLDWMHRRPFNVRAGLVLMPLGLVNEFHEPTVFPGTERPDVETFLIPTTWRELGAGVWGEAGFFTYRGYFSNGLNAAGFNSEGIREGRQEGSQALAKNWAVSGRLDWTGVPEVVLGAAFFTGGSGQGQPVLSGRTFTGQTTLFEVHGIWQWRAIDLRGLYAHTSVSDAALINQLNNLEGGESVGSRQVGWYVQGGYDLLSLRPGSKSSLILFARYEKLDTQASVPAGYQRNPASNRRVWTAGISFKPIDRIVVKADYQRRTNAASRGVNQWNAGLGYVF